MIDKLKKLFSFLQNTNDFDKIKNTVYTYKNLDNTIKIVSPHRDIVEFNKAITKILELDLFTTYLDKNKLIPISNNYLTLKYWCTDNSRMLNDINKELLILCDNSKLLLSRYKQLNKLKRSNTIISFNTRELKRYIINIEQVKSILLNKESNE